MEVVCFHLHIPHSLGCIIGWLGSIISENSNNTTGPCLQIGLFLLSYLSFILKLAMRWPLGGIFRHSCLIWGPSEILRD